MNDLDDDDDDDDDDDSDNHAKYDRAVSVPCCASVFT
jgi:hypothetical protein